MEHLNIYHRSDGRWEGRILRGKNEKGNRKSNIFSEKAKNRYEGKWWTFSAANFHKVTVQKQYRYCFPSGMAVSATE